MKVQQLGIFIETDVLIIGGGIAGLFAAIKAKDEDPLTEVLLVDKCYPGASGSSVFAAGVIPNWQPGDDFDSYVKEIIVDNAEYMIDQDYVEVAVRESYDRVRDLIEYGVEFQQNEKGEILRIPALSSSFQNCTAFKGGLQWMWKLRAQATKRQVEMLERIFVADLLMDNGRCVGAVGFHLRTGEFYVFKAKSTILANGSAIYARPQLGPSGTTGDAQAMALRAGLQLRSMEQVFATIGPAGISSPGLHAIFGNGGILVNRKGERVMEKYNPGLMERARRFEMARAILQEWRESKGPCYVDCTHLPKENIERIKTSLPFFIAGLNILGLDLTRDKIEWVPYSLSLQHNGGIRINNADGDVNVPGLWAVGTAGDYCGGVDTTAAAALPGSAVQGARAGRRAAEHAKQVSAGAVDMEQMYTLKENIYKPLIAKPAGEKIKVSHAFSRLSQVVLTYVNLFKDEAMLNRGIEEIGKLRYECSAAIAKDPHELGKVHELRNLIQVSEAIAKSALVRTESRKCHYRLDYPTRDDKNWLKWISAKLVNGSLELWTEEIPIDKWEYKPPTV